MTDTTDVSVALFIQYTLVLTNKELFKQSFFQVWHGVKLDCCSDSHVNIECFEGYFGMPRATA